MFMFAFTKALGHWLCGAQSEEKRPPPPPRPRRRATSAPQCGRRGRRVPQRRPGSRPSPAAHPRPAPAAAGTPSRRPRVRSPSECLGVRLGGQRFRDPPEMRRFYRCQPADLGCYVLFFPGLPIFLGCRSSQQSGQPSRATQPGNPAGQPWATLGNPSPAGISAACFPEGRK